MKRALVLALLTLVVLSGCGGDTVRAYLGDNSTPVPVATPTPNPATAKAKATPAQGNWMWKDYQNPLDASKKKPKK